MLALLMRLWQPCQSHTLLFPSSELKIKALGALGNTVYKGASGKLTNSILEQRLYLFSLGL